MKDVSRMLSATRLTYIGHATVLIETKGVRILTDPLLRNRVGFLHRCRSKIDSNSYRSIDVVLISHIHKDHLDIPSLRLLDNSVLLIVPEGASGYLNQRGYENVNEIKVGEDIQIGPLKISATPAHHFGNRNFFGPSAECLGFVVHGNHNIYFAGDTDLFQEMSSLRDGLDVALLPVWGWGPTLGRGHLDPRRAAEALKLLHPKVVIPIHWGTYCPIGMEWASPNYLTNPPHDFAHHASRLIPEVDVRVVEPGDYIELSD
ncbi:MAG: MBL fold metallo-hydrolase [Nitrososphaerales archaeon]